MTTLEKKLSDKYALYSILPKAEQRGFIKAYALLEEEISELKEQIKKLQETAQSTI